ncbi:hypothetical protein B0H17DRAFT_1213391 [Mycena rosella]|uniref:Uncharacterized protein n=1 Tax=Mycena rosella TaxID=1033263 RepID=A0AAD7G1D5_MYCRO|nr:hypothetical protein B0H17DRAFT_1213391 [Mycena rosella]
MPAAYATATPAAPPPNPRSSPTQTLNQPSTCTSHLSFLPHTPATPSRRQPALRCMRARPAQPPSARTPPTRRPMTPPSRRGTPTSSSSTSKRSTYDKVLALNVGNAVLINVAPFIASLLRSLDSILRVQLVTRRIPQFVLGLDAILPSFSTELTDCALVLCVPTLTPAPPQLRIRVGDLHPGTRPTGHALDNTAGASDARSVDSQQHGKGRTTPPDASLRVHREQRLHRRRGVCGLQPDISCACADVVANATPGA